MSCLALARLFLETWLRKKQALEKSFPSSNTYVGMCIAFISSQLFGVSQKSLWVEYVICVDTLGIVFAQGHSVLDTVFVCLQEMNLNVNFHFNKKAIYWSMEGLILQPTKMTELLVVIAWLLYGKMCSVYAQTRVVGLISWINSYFKKFSGYFCAM